MRCRQELLRDRVGSLEAGYYPGSPNFCNLTGKDLNRQGAKVAKETFSNRQDAKNAKFFN